METTLQFLHVFKHYLVEILPALAIGFFLSGLIHELVPSRWVEEGLGKKGIRPILYSTICGTVLPICCWGSLPVALSFYKKGARLGPILAFLVATPATSITALLVAYKLLGLTFTVYIFFAVIVMGLIMGMVGNRIEVDPKSKKEETCPHCGEEEECHHCKISFGSRIKSTFRFAFFDMVKDIGPELLVGIVLAAVVATVIPIGKLVEVHLSGILAYPFSVVFGLIMYICSTATVPLVHALVVKGMNIGAGMVLLLVGPITSYGTILVLRKEFGVKLLMVYLTGISCLSLALGWLFSLIVQAS